MSIIYFVFGLLLVPSCFAFWFSSTSCAILGCIDASVYLIQLMQHDFAMACSLVVEHVYKQFFKLMMAFQLNNHVCVPAYA